MCGVVVMQIISAYAPPTFLQPVLVYMTCQCDDTGEGAHMLGCWVDALNTDHAYKLLGQALADAHTGGAQWFKLGDYPSIYTALEAHTKMALDMQNGSGEEKWEAGFEPYLKIREQFQDAPAYETPVPA